MNRKELKQMIREEVRTEILRALPKLIGEALNEIIATAPKPKGGQRRRKQVIKEGKRPTTEKSFDRSELTSLMGYGDLDSPRAKSAPTPQTVAGVPMEGGLVAKESMAGMAHFRDYTDSEAPIVTPGESGEMGPVGPVEGEYDPQFSSMPALPGGVDGGAEVPANIVAALRKRSKKVLEEAEFKANWRPGMKKNG